MLYVGVKRNWFKRDISVTDKDTIPSMLYTMQILLYITFSYIGKSIECK